MKLESFKDFMRREVEKIGVEKIKDYKKQLEINGNFKSLEKRLIWDVYWAIPSNQTDFLSDFGKFKKENNVNDINIETLLKFILKEYDII